MITENTINSVETANDKFTCPDLHIRLIELSGLVPVLESLHLPFKKEASSETAKALHFTIDEDTEDSIAGTITGTWSACITNKDRALLRTLVSRGDEHAKCIRGVMVYLEIAAPLYFWKQMDTYRFGTDRLSSESTMHVDCRGLTDEELEAAQKSITNGYIQKRVQVFSYQTLRRIYMQRKDDRLRIWRDFCNFIQTLPLAKDWITAPQTKRL